jgi:predicted MFS family arabinose efflux permease
MVYGGGYIIGTAGYRSLFLIAAALTVCGTLLFWAYFCVPRGELASDPVGLEVG